MSPGRRQSSSPEVASSLRAERLARGLTQAELSERAGIALETVSRIEQGHTRPTLRTLEKLGVALGVSVARLLEKATAEVEADRSEEPLSPDLRRLMEIVPRLDSAAIQHLLGIARLLLRKQQRARKDEGRG